MSLVLNEVLGLFLGEIMDEILGLGLEHLKRRSV